MIGKPVDGGHPDQDQGKDHVHHGEHAVSRAPHGVVQAEHDGKQEVEGHDGPQIDGACPDDGGGVGEEAHQGRPQGNEHQHHRRPDHGGNDRDADALPCPVQAPGADVLPHEGGDGVGKALHRQEGQGVQLGAHVVGGGILLAEGVHLAHDRHGADGHQGHLDARGQADAHDLAEEGLVEPASEGADGDLGIAAVDIEQAEQPGEGLGDDGAQGHAQHAHAAPQHEYQVQHDVHHRRDGQEQQRGPAVAQAAQNAGVQVVADGADEARGHHHQVQPGLGPGVGLHLHQQQDGLHQCQGQGRDGDGGDHKGGVDGVHRVPDPVHVPGAVELGDDHGAAVGEAHEQRCEHKDDGIAHAHRRQGGIAGVVAHHPAVHHVVELLEEAACQQWQGKVENMSGGAAHRHVAHTVFTFHVEIPHMIFVLFSTLLPFLGWGNIVF